MSPSCSPPPSRTRRRPRPVRAPRYRSRGRGPVLKFPVLAIRSSAPQALPPTLVAGVRLRRSRRLLLCDANGVDVGVGEMAIVATSTGPEIAKVVLATAPSTDDAPLQGRKVLRPASDADLSSQHRQVLGEVAARMEFFRAAFECGLEVSSVHADYSFDGTRLRFRFRCDESHAGTGLRAELESRFRGVSLQLKNLGRRRDSQRGACGGGSCSTCPSNGLLERSGAAVPEPGMARRGQFSAAAPALA